MVFRANEIEKLWMGIHLNHGHCKGIIYPTKDIEIVLKYHKYAIVVVSWEIGCWVKYLMRK